MTDRRPSLMEPRIEQLMDRVESKFTLVTLSAMRARQINDYYNQLGEGLGRIVRDAAGQVTAIVEEKAATPEQRTIAEINVGVYAFALPWLWGALQQLQPSAVGEYYLTDVVAAAIAHSTGMSVRLARCVIVYIMPSGMMPLPVGVSVAMMKRSKALCRSASRAQSSVVRKFPAVQTCNAMVDSRITRSKSASGIAVGKGNQALFGRRIECDGGRFKRTIQQDFKIGRI